MILVHHEGYQGGRMRGHSSVTGLVDASIGIESQDDSSAESAAKTMWLRLYNGKQRNEERAEPMVLTLEKPEEELESALITGRPDPEQEKTLLPLFGKGGKAVAKAEGGLPFDALEYKILQAIREGAKTPKEVRAAVPNLTQGTEHNRRMKMVERGWLEWDKKVITLTHLGDAAFIKASEGREEVK